MKNYTKILLHFLLWGIVLIVPFYIMTRGSQMDYKPYISFLVRTSILAVLFYANYLYLIDKLLFTKHFIYYILSNIVLIAILLMIQTIILESLVVMSPNPSHGMPSMSGNGWRPPRMPGDFIEGGKMRGKPDGPFNMRIFTDYLLIILVIGMSVATKVTFRWNRDSINLEKAKSVQLEADLRNLRSQLNPHFLFNTLNNIYSLIAIDTDKAQDSVHRLSNLLRYVLYENDQNFVPIDKEIEFTRNYIDLMKLRLSSSVKLNVLIENNGSKDLIASLLFITLIENAFKHGIHSNTDSFIDINIFVEADKGVLCTVENSLFEKEKNMEERNSGIGLANLSKRLELLYPGKHEFVIEKRTDRFFAMLRVDFNKPKDVIQ